MIPSELIDQILDKTDIVEIVSGYIPIKKAGQGFKGLCPFHKEKTPSFMVSPAKQIFRCFGCGSGGNAISFLMKYECMDFIEAVKTLADKANIALPRFGNTEKKENSFAEKLYGVNDLACSFYQENLTKECGKEGYRYFIQRGINETIIKHFRLGFAQDSWQGLINHCKKDGVESEILEKAGLILQNETSGNRYDRFRNRVIFPIFDMRSKIVGFGGRALDKAIPKYINSPETCIYTKGRHLYGLNFSKEYTKTKNYVIIVEGYFDLILPFQNEIRNIVATLGTALTVEQINTLKRFTKNVIMIYDPDKAGEEATLRGLDLLIEEDMNVRIAVLPKGTDPDSFVRKEKKDAFMKILKESKDLFDYKLDILSTRFRKDLPGGKARIVEGMLPTLAKIKNAVLKSSYVKRMAEGLSIDEESVRTELKKVKTGFTPPLGQGAGFISVHQALADRERGSLGNMAEIMLLAIVFEDNSCIEKIEKELGFRTFKDGSIGAILEKISHLYKNGKRAIPSHLITYFEDEKSKDFISEAAHISQTIQDRDRALKDCLKHLRKDNLKQALNNIQFKIKEAEATRDFHRVNKLIAEYDALIKGFKE